MPLGFVFGGLALGLLFAVAYRVLPARTELWQRSRGRPGLLPVDVNGAATRGWPLP